MAAITTLQGHWLRNTIDQFCTSLRHLAFQYCSSVLGWIPVNIAHARSMFDKLRMPHPVVIGELTLQEGLHE